MGVTIASEALAEIRARADSAVSEVCGLLLGAGDRIAHVVHCRNVAADPAMAFEVDPAQLLAAHRVARAGGPAVLGCYHSHPSGAADPSPRDAAAAAPDRQLWLIVANGQARLWRAVPAGARHGRFDEVGLRVTACAVT